MPAGSVVRLATPVPVDVAGTEATVKVCGVTVAMPQGHSWAPHRPNGRQRTWEPAQRRPPLSTACGQAGRLVAG